MLLYCSKCGLCFVFLNGSVYIVGIMYGNTSSRPEVFCKKGVVRNFTKFTGKPLYQSLLFNKVAGLRPEKETLAQVFSCEFCEISKNTFFRRTPLEAASVEKKQSSLFKFGFSQIMNNQETTDIESINLKFPITICTVWLSCQLSYICFICYHYINYWFLHLVYILCMMNIVRRREGNIIVLWNKQWEIKDFWRNYQG